MNIRVSSIRAIASRLPAVIPLLSDKARYIIASARATEYKTYDYYLSTLQNLVESVYNGYTGGGFIDIMANLISGQLSQAFRQAWTDDGDGGAFPDYLQPPLEDMILSEYDHVDGFYRDIVDARVDELPIDGLLARCPLWAQRWIEAYNLAVSLIVKQAGGNLMWELGATEQHCPECAALNGIVARASEWEALGVRPQGAPNALLTCGGWQCDCKLSPTDKRRSPDAYGRIMDIVSK